jgi:hypothetical protein
MAQESYLRAFKFWHGMDSLALFGLFAVTTMLVWYTLADWMGNDALNDECHGTPIKIANRCFQVAKSRVAKAVLSGSSATKIRTNVDRKSFQSLIQRSIRADED